MESRKALNKIFSTITTLAKQSLALRGHDETRSNLLQFLYLRAEDVPKQKKNWLQHIGDKWLHHSIVNEILGVISESLLHLLRVPFTPKLNFYLLIYTLPKILIILHQDNK